MCKYNYSEIVSKMNLKMMFNRIMNLISIPVCLLNVYVILWHYFDDQPIADRTVSISLRHFGEVRSDAFYMLMISYMVLYFLSELRNAFLDHILDL